MNRLKNRDGTTMVEVLVGFALMLLLIGMFYGAVRFADSSMKKAAQIRENAAAAAANLRLSLESGTPEGEGEEAFVFKAKGGDVPLFTIKAKKIKYTVKLADQTPYEFRLFARLEKPEAGGSP